MKKITIVTVFLAVFGFLFGLTYAHFGTATGHRLKILTYTVYALIFGSLLLLRLPSWRQRVGVLGVILGLLVFLFSLSGGGVWCNDMGYPDDAEHGVTYDWDTNTLKFGDNLDGELYRCEGEPVRPGVLAGYLLISGGLVSVLRNPQNSA